MESSSIANLLKTISLLPLDTINPSFVSLTILNGLLVLGSALGLMFWLIFSVVIYYYYLGGTSIRSSFSFSLLKMI